MSDVLDDKRFWSYEEASHLTDVYLKLEYVSQDAQNAMKRHFAQVGIVGMSPRYLDNKIAFKFLNDNCNSCSEDYVMFWDDCVYFGKGLVERK